MFFVALFPQFLSPGAAVLPAALAMAAVIVMFDIACYGAVAALISRFHQALHPRLVRFLENSSPARYCSASACAWRQKAGRDAGASLGTSRSAQCARMATTGGG